jgi:hypothetical protein
MSDNHSGSILKSRTYGDWKHRTASLDILCEYYVNKETRLFVGIIQPQSPTDVTTTQQP